MLSDAQLEESMESLHAKLKSSRRTLAASYIAWSLVSFGIMAGGLLLLWFGPNSFIDRILGVRQVNMTTTMVLWWLAVVGVAVVGGAMGVQAITGKVRLAHHWKHRVMELEMRLQEVELEKKRRIPTAEPPGSARFKPNF